MAAAGGNLVEIINDRHFLEEFQKASDRLLVLDFTAKWCGPCQYIAPFFAKCSESYKNVMFLKVDVDQCQETALKYGVSSMPTFLFILKGKILERVRGANPQGLEVSVKKWSKFADTETKKESVTLGRQYECFLELLKNSKESFMSVSELLTRFANNILKDQQNEKYRSIRLENKIFQEKLLPFSGAVECLFQMGFQEQDDRLVMPMDSPLDHLRALLSALLDERERINNENAPVDSFPPAQPLENPLKKFSPSSRNMGNRSFYEKLRSSSDHVFIYENPEMLNYASSKIPISRLTNEAKEMMKDGNNESNIGNDEKDCLLLLLLKWFKTEFFTWMDQPQCEICNTKTQAIGHAQPTEDDRKWGAGIVEEYRCANCGRQYRFPRYNHPQKLLETRKGRCGEWANCFTACCRAAGFETRYVLDWTDHVWTEVYSEHQQRWLHCDPCENVCDKPLLYESGWGKKLSYIIAFSSNEVIDVTWRYTKNQQEVLKRRNEVSESWLVSLWMNMTKQLQGASSSSKKEELEKRRIKELVEFLCSKETSDEEKVGRQSGSMAWRLQRGETGEINNEVSAPYAFIPTNSELEKGKLRVRYCAASDKYTRGDELGIEAEQKEGWQNGVSDCSKIFRKVEQDWNMVYLARDEGTLEGRIAWTFKIKDDAYVFEKIDVKVSSKTFENGSVQWILAIGELEEIIPYQNDVFYTSTKCNGCSTIELSAKLTSGKGDVAWQHAQLFRQGTENINKYPFDITVWFRKK